MNKNIALLIGAIALHGAGQLSAQNLISNPSFESTTFTPQVFFQAEQSVTSGLFNSVTSDPGWTHTSQTFGYAGPTTDGGNGLLMLVGTSGATISQNISLVGGTSYDLSFDTYGEFGATGSAIGNVSMSGGLLSTTQISELVDGIATTRSYNFTPLASGSYTLSLGLDSASSNDLVFDNFNLAAVPEPSSGVFLGLAGLAFILRRRK